MIKAYKFHDANKVFVYDDLYLSDTFVDRVLNSSDPITVDPTNPYGAFLTSEQYENLILKLITEVKSLNEKPTPQVNTDHRCSGCGACKSTKHVDPTPKATKEPPKANPTPKETKSKSTSYDLSYDKETNLFNYTKKILNEDGSLTTTSSSVPYDELPHYLKVLLMNPHFRF